MYKRNSDKGILTLEFKDPPHQLMLSEVSETNMKFLLHLTTTPQSDSNYKNIIKDALIDGKLLKEPTADVVRMTVWKRRDYPAITGVGFPRTLEYLTVSTGAYRKLDYRIAALELLQVLDLKNNLLTTLPARLWEMKNLTHLELQGNGGCNVF